MITKGYGLTINDIDQSCPTDLEPYEMAHEKEMEEQDYMQYLWWGRYGISAFTYAIEHCFVKKPRSEYVKESALSKIFEQKNLTEEQIYEKEIRQLLLAEEQWIMAGKRSGLPETII